MAMDKSIRSAEFAHLCAVLREMRLERDLLQVDVAEKLGRPQNYVSRYETGEQRLDLIELDRVVEALGFTLEELVRRYRQAVRSAAGE